MSMIPESIIDQVTDRLSESDPDYDEALEQLKSEQPAMLAFLFSENFAAFTTMEQDYLLFLSTIVWQSVREAGAQVPEVSIAELEEAEEANWERMSAAQGRTFRQRLNVFFVDYPQEDLLAFVEDALTEDEDAIVTPEAREHLFVSLKTLIDCLAPTA